MNGAAGTLLVIGKRLVNAVIVLLVLSFMVFAFMRAIPGDPVMNLLGEEETTEEQYQELSRELGLDQPYAVQYYNWISHVVQGDFGRSLQTNEPVLPVIWHKLKATIELALVAVLFGTILGLTAGIVSAVKRNSIFDTAAMVFSLS